MFVLSKPDPEISDARGEAAVESKQGYIEVEAKFDKLQPASRFGPEYLTSTSQARVQSRGQWRGIFRGMRPANFRNISARRTHA